MSDTFVYTYLYKDIVYVYVYVYISYIWLKAQDFGSKRATDWLGTSRERADGPGDQDGKDRLFAEE